MKKLNRIGIAVCLLLGVFGCTKDNFIETGISNGRFHGSLLEYLEKDDPLSHYNWDSTALLVRQAGPDMVRLFEGKDPAYPEITFLGPTNHSIRRYMLDKKIKRIADMEPARCQEMLLRLIIKGKFYRKDILDAKLGENGEVVSGGNYFQTLGGNTLSIYAFTEQVEGVIGIGHRGLYVYSGATTLTREIASADIEPDNCVVHSLVYGYTLGDF